MDTELKTVIDGLESAQRTKELLAYAQEQCEDTWNAMLDTSNGMTPGNRRDCAKRFVKEEILYKIIRDIVKPISHQGPDPIKNLYNDLYDYLRF